MCVALNFRKQIWSIDLFCMEWRCQQIPQSWTPAGAVYLFPVQCFCRKCSESVAVQLLWKTISTNLTATSVLFSARSSKGPGALLWTGWLGMFTGLTIPECIGSATTQLTGPAWGTPSMWGSWRDQTAPGSSPALQESHMQLLSILKGGMYPSTSLSFGNPNKTEKWSKGKKIMTAIV